MDPGTTLIVKSGFLGLMVHTGVLLTPLLERKRYENAWIMARHRIKLTDQD